MTRTTQRLAALAAVLMLVGSAFPAAAQTAPPDTERMAAAEELVTSMGGDDQGRASVAAFVDAINAELRQKVPDKAPVLEAYLKTEAAPDKPRTTELLADLKKLAVGFYAERFTTEELKALSAFQKSPAGRKFQEATPRLMTLLAGRMLDFQSTLMRDLQGQIGK